MTKRSMGRRRAEKLHVTFAPGAGPSGPAFPRTYTLTHSDLTGDLFLTIGPGYDRAQISGLYARLIRDGILAEWSEDEEGLALQVHCHVIGGLVFGSAEMRLVIFRQGMPLALEALRCGDHCFFDAYPSLDRAPVLVHWHADQRRYNTVEGWGIPADYREQDRFYRTSE